MQDITITIEGFGATHTFQIPAAVAEGWLASQGISLTSAEEALSKAALLIVKPIVQLGLAAQASAQEAQILSLVEEGE